MLTLFDLSSISWNSGLLWPAAGCLALSVLVGYMVYNELRYIVRKQRSRNWPTTTATIDNVVIGDRSPRSVVPRILFRVHFTYTYRVRETQYVGGFFLLVQGREAAEDNARKLFGRTVIVKYDEGKPKVAFVGVDELDGQRVMQGPSWSYR